MRDSLVFTSETNIVDSYEICIICNILILTFNTPRRLRMVCTGMRIRVEEEMDFFEKSKSEKLLFCIWVWRNAKKIFGPIGPFWNMRNWQIKKTYLHYMSIFQSCRILAFYSLNESIRGVQEENIIMLGFSSRILVGK